MPSQCIAETDKIDWQGLSRYHQRSWVETAIGRYKQVIGTGLRFRKDGRRSTEVAVRVLNRVPEPGRPLSVRIA